MKKAKQILKITIISIVIIGLVATYLLAGFTPAPRRETAPEPIGYGEVYNDTQALTPANEEDPGFLGPPAGEVPHTGGPTTLSP